MSSPIPVIDISSGATSEVVAQLRHAGENVGLCQVAGHGVPLSLVRDWERRIDRLLALPTDEKAEPARPTGHPFGGCGSGLTTSGGWSWSGTSTPDSRTPTTHAPTA